MTGVDPLAFLRTVESAIARVHVGNVIAPLLWLIGLLLAAYVWTKDHAILQLVTVLIFFTLAAYAWFAARDPKWLRGEGFQLRHEHMQMLAQGKGAPVQVDPTGLPALPNPAAAKDKSNGEEQGG